MSAAFVPPVREDLVGIASYGAPQLDVPARLNVNENPFPLPDDPTVLSYLVTAAMVLPMAERQHLLAAPSTGERLALARRLLHRETTLITVLSALPAIDLTGTRPSVN